MNYRTEEILDMVMPPIIGLIIFVVICLVVLWGGERIGFDKMIVILLVSILLSIENKK